MAPGSVTTTQQEHGSLPPGRRLWRTQPACSCSSAADDFMVGRRAYGAIDAKATTVEMVESLSLLAVSGPSPGSGNLPAFSWQSSGFTQPLHVPTDTFTFPAVRAEWSSNINAEAFSTIATTTTTTAAAVT